MTDCKVREKCRLCNLPIQFGLDLGKTPLANELLSDPDASAAQERFPLYLSTCGACGHVQLPVVVKPERLFRSYVYVSGTSPVFVKHLADQADALVDAHGLTAGDFVVEVGSNDGTLLEQFKRHGCDVLGVDPAQNIAAIANKRGVRTLPDFFTKGLARTIRELNGPAKLVVANNVYAHADNLAEITRGVAELLADGGTFVFEVGYFPEVAHRGMFDTVYHEHLSYHHLRPLVPFLAKRGLQIVDACRVDSQGGSVRVTAKKQRNGPVSEGLDILLGQEIEGRFPLEEFKKRIEWTKTTWDKWAGTWRKEGKRVCAYGAPAKAVTLANVLGIDESVIDFIVEDNPLKHGKFLPGTRVPILPVDELYTRKADVCVIFAWNFAESLMAKHADWNRKGRAFCVPLPHFAVKCGVDE